MRGAQVCGLASSRRSRSRANAKEVEEGKGPGRLERPFMRRQKREEGVRSHIARRMRAFDADNRGELQSTKSPN